MKKPEAEGTYAKNFVKYFAGYTLGGCPRQVGDRTARDGASPYRGGFVHDFHVRPFAVVR